MRWLGGAIAILLILAAAVLLSTDRRAIRLRVVGAAFALQAGIAVLVLLVPAGRGAIAWLSRGVGELLGYSRAGTEFLFGPLARPPFGQAFVIAALPTIVFFASLVAILYHLGIMQRVVRWIGGALERVTGISRVESLCAAANIFVGQSESPLVIRPYLPALTPPQLFCVMSSGMAGIAGTIMAAYAALGVPIAYLLAASFMSAPGGILMAKLIMPDPRGEPVAEPDAAPVAAAEHAANLIEAAAQGALTGLRLAVAVGAMVFAFVALTALVNGILGAVGAQLGFAGLSLQTLLGFVFAPVMRLLGVPAGEAGIAGGLLGEKIVLNEFVAFLDLARAQPSLSPRTIAIVTFALCGFANFGSIAIQMAVTGSLAPTQRAMVARLGLRALAAGSLANLMSAALAGMILPF